MSRRSLSRRAFLRSAAGAAFAAAGVALYARYVEPHWIEVTHRLLTLPGLPPELEGRTLVHLSDLHVGPRVSSDDLISVLELAKGLDADLVAFTGDFVTWRMPRVEDELARVLDHLGRGRIATVGILGNHDYGPNWSHPEIAARVEARARAAGIDLLRNRWTTIAGLQVAGLDDLWANRFDPEPVFATVDRRRPVLGLCHNPDALDRPGWEGVNGWVLAGHTHGGQVRPPFLPPPILPVRNRRYAAGEVAVRSGLTMYVSRGIGHLLRVRFCVRPEITLFTLAGSGA